MSTTDLISKQREARWAWIWMAYTGFLFITPVLEPSRALWLGTLSVFFIFVGFMGGYIRTTDEGHPLRFWIIGATFLLGLAAFPWNQGASCLFAYAAAFLPFSIASIRRVLVLQAAMLLAIFAEGYLFHARHDAFHISWANTYIAIFISIVVGGGNIFFAEQKRADCRLRAAQEENVALAAVAERERIARDLHDVLGHTLSVIVLKAELAKRLIATDPTRATAEVGDIETITRTALAEVREAIGGYRTRGLSAEIEAARGTLASAGVTLLTATPDADTPVADTLGADTPGAPRLDSETWAANSRTPLTPQEETVLSLALREAVTNIVRHARATTCRLRFVAENGHRRLIVEDDGQHTAPREGNGLRGMRERIESMGGQLLLEREHGTRLSIDLPVRAA